MTSLECTAHFIEAVDLLINATWVVNAVMGLLCSLLGYLYGKNVAFKNWIESPLPCETINPARGPSVFRKEKQGGDK